MPAWQCTTCSEAFSKAPSQRERLNGVKLIACEFAFQQRQRGIAAYFRSVKTFGMVLGASLGVHRSRPPLSACLQNCASAK